MKIFCFITVTAFYFGFALNAAAQSLPDVTPEKSALINRINKEVRKADAVRLATQVAEDDERMSKDTADFTARIREVKQSEHQIEWDRTYGDHMRSGSLAGLFYDANGDMILASTQGQYDSTVKCVRPSCGYDYVRLIRLNQDGTVKKQITNFRLINGETEIMTDMSAAVPSPDGGFLIGVTVYSYPIASDAPQLPRLVKLNRLGKIIWTHDFEPRVGLNYNEIDEILILKNGDALLAVNESESGGYQTHIYRLSQDGQILWKQIVVNSAVKNPLLELDDGTLMVGVGVKSFEKFTASGQPIPGGEVFGPGLIARTSNGDIVTARFNGRKYQGAYGKFARDLHEGEETYLRLAYLTIEKRSPSGDLLWSVDDFGVEGLFGRGLEAITVLPSGDILIAGAVQERILVSTEAFIARVGPDGSRKWIRYLPSNMSIEDRASEILIDSDGSILVGSLTKGVTSQSRKLRHAQPPWQEFVSRVTRLGKK